MAPAKKPGKQPSKQIEALRRRLSETCSRRFRGSMSVGKAPGRDETRLGRPFVGKAGSFFVKVLEDALRLKRENIYITNVLKIWPNVETKRLRTRKPEKDEREFFIPYLMEEIDIIAPDVIIAVGKTAFFALLPDSDFMAGEWLEFEGRPVMPVYHPSYILRRQKRLDESVGELRKALLKVRKKLD